MGGKLTRVFIGFLCWACWLYEILSAPNLGPGYSAQPPSAKKLLNSIVCEGQKAYISCQSIFDQIKIEKTMFGRKDKSICVHPSLPSNTECQEQELQVNAQIRGLCEGENDCEISAYNDFMAKAGTTICPNVYKYLHVKYSPENSQSVSEVITANGMESHASSSVTSSTLSTSTSASLPEITVQEGARTQPVKIATSQASVTPFSHQAIGNDVTEEYTQPESSHDVVTETFPSGEATSKSAEVNETFKKSDTPKYPAGSGEEPSEEDSGSGEWEGDNEQRDIVYDAALKD
ncbi:L-rhamnose-binding lectin ELEL-1 [Acropora cervicornis]|uniref:L-rhamnose-binding lectin ELEL-1 n=1 Tax=Acropora cervicornis TaxID=6130 RepID=A0AAD9QDK6_ACRCE|nr:L-rhamnose-binding lectin ELEL-1 [Acropora cervicornis]